MPRKPRVSKAVGHDYDDNHDRQQNERCPSMTRKMLILSDSVESCPVRVIRPKLNRVGTVTAVQELGGKYRTLVVFIYHAPKSEASSPCR